VVQLTALPGVALGYGQGLSLGAGAVTVTVGPGLRTTLVCVGPGTCTDAVRVTVTVGPGTYTRLVRVSCGDGDAVTVKYLVTVETGFGLESPSVLEESDSEIPV
jgi:hypothetical protein